MMLYLTEDWNIMKAAAVVNIEEGISSVIGLIICILTCAYVGRFRIVLFTTAAFILGLVLLWLSTWLFPLEMKAPIFYVALLLISFGKAGKDPPFKDFLGDQLSGKDDEQIYDRTKFLWRTLTIFGAFISVFFLSAFTWNMTFLTSASVMFVTYVMFLAGVIFYPYKKTPPTGNPFYVFYKVFKFAFTKRGLAYPRTPSGYFLNERNELQLFPSDPFLRWIDRAAIVEQASPNQQVEKESTDEKLCCSVAEVRKTKSLLRLIPLWFAFILYGIVTAAGNTFFIEQASGLDETWFPVNGFFVVTPFVSLVTSCLAYFLVSKYGNRNEEWILKSRLIQVGVGIAISILCCEVASRIENSRLHKIHTYGDPDILKDVSLPMSNLWLAPQFILLGFMDGLSEDGLRKLFYILVDKSFAELEDPINQLMLGIGKVMSIGCVFIFRSWFGHTINTSRLDKYFNMLVYLSLFNLAFYVTIGYYYVSVIQFESDNPQEEAEERKDEVVELLVDPEPRVSRYWPVNISSRSFSSRSLSSRSLSS